MNSRSIRNVINTKLRAWIKTIDDAKVRKLIEKNTLLTGGSIANMLLNEEVKDYDIYFKNRETTLAVAQYYVAKFNDSKKAKVANIVEERTRIKIMIESTGVAVEDGKEYVLDSPTDDPSEALEDSDTEALEKPRYRPVFLSSNAITLSDKIQIVVRFYGEPEEIHKNYDFVHCTNYYDFGKDELVLRPEAMECLLAKELRYQGSKYPLCSVIRTRKFIKRGFFINAGQFLKMCFQLSKLDLTDLKVLEDQLIGVDSAYFNMLVTCLQSKKASDQSFVLTSGYLAELIDRIF